MSGGPDVDRWWAALTAAALVGAGRGRVPAVPDALGVVPRADADAPTALLDAAALGGALQLAGAVPAPATTTPAPCPPDAAPEAPPRAVQVLRLVLTQPPVGRELRDALLERWCAAVAAHGRRVPHALLPALLAEATRRPDVRAAVLGVVDARGRWLAARRAEWSWAVDEGAATPAAADDAALLRLPVAELVARVTALRATDPGRGRRVVAAVLPTAGAETRAGLLHALSGGLGPADEDVLEAALDDRAATVRAAAAEVLDGLPTSARAARMAARLAPLLTVHGLVRKRLEVAPPGALDAAARRDGLGAGPGGARDAAVLSALVTGAPLDVLTAAARTDPAGVLRMDAERVLRAAVRRAVVARRDAVWARALLAEEWDAAATAVLPPAEGREAARRWLAATPADVLASIAHALPGPWDAALSHAVAEAVAQVAADPATTRTLVLPVEALGRQLHPAAREPLARARDAADRAAADAERAVERARDPQESARLATALAAFRTRARALTDLTQHLSLLATTDEALA
ncbi:DUF5691 domain-containing protein [Cellulomonas sp. 179-A 9B4 NHS]|uniref:DUF5691 domain-containing protein n=1 Tax=Cellulomonas sp. 179-A 9B4 NHS TaxID=3142379 RepID=UPI0039A208AA